jgi:Family of unknown function (DUF6463)
MRGWIGKSIIAIGLIHVCYGVAVFQRILGILFEEGLINSVNGQPNRELAFWFIAFGVVLVLLGALADYCEQGASLPQFFGWALLVFTALVLLIMPASGGWLLLIPSIGAIVRSRRMR